MDFIKNLIGTLKFIAPSGRHKKSKHDLATFFNIEVHKVEHSRREKAKLGIRNTYDYKYSNAKALSNLESLPYSTIKPDDEEISRKLLDLLEKRDFSEIIVIKNGFKYHF